MSLNRNNVAYLSCRLDAAGSSEKPLNLRSLHILLQSVRV